MNKSIKLLHIEKYDAEWPPENLAMFIEWAKDLLDQIPDEYKSTATIDLGSRSGYEGDHYADIEVTYTRPETEGEAAEREHNALRTKMINEARDRQEYERLKARFGN